MAEMSSSASAVALPPKKEKTIVKRAPYVDLVLWPAKHCIASVRHDPRLDVKRQPTTGRHQLPGNRKFDHLPTPRAEGPSAFVSIMEGCSKYCSFCVVPYTRGEEVSRPFEDVLTEIAHLATQGVREINLLGQNVNAYRGAMDPGPSNNTNPALPPYADLGLLIRAIAQSESIGRIRFTTSHPLEFSDSP